jgi:hypothetical protein
LAHRIEFRRESPILQGISFMAEDWKQFARQRPRGVEPKLTAGRPRAPLSLIARGGLSRITAVDSKTGSVVTG